MILYMHIVLAGVDPFKRKVRIKVPEGTTVEEALELYKEKYKTADALGSLKGVSILVNDSRGSFGQELKNKDKVKLFRPVSRG